MHQRQLCSTLTVSVPQSQEEVAFIQPLWPTFILFVGVRAMCSETYKSLYNTCKVREVSSWFCTMYYNIQL